MRTPYSIRTSAGATRTTRRVDRALSGTWTSSAAVSRTAERNADVISEDPEKEENGSPGAGFLGNCDDVRSHLGSSSARCSSLGLRADRYYKCMIWILTLLGRCALEPNTYPAGLSEGGYWVHKPKSSKFLLVSIVTETSGVLVGGFGEHLLEKVWQVAYLKNPHELLVDGQDAGPPPRERVPGGGSCWCCRK